jgi:GT2 family glycosyltransferase
MLYHNICRLESGKLVTMTISTVITSLDADTAKPSDLPVSSLIICSRNRPEMLYEAIETIIGGDDVPSELIIIDQSDSLNQRLEAFTTTKNCSIKYHWSHEIGLSRANNKGVALALNDILIFTHDDVNVTSDWYGQLIRSLTKAGPRNVVTGKIGLTTEEAPGGFQLTMKLQDFPEVYEGRVGKDVLFPLNMAMFKSALIEVGGFDDRIGPGTDFPAAEDNDLGFRLLEAGYRIIYEPKALLYHRTWRSKDAYLPLRLNYAIGQGGFYAKHLSLRDRYMLKRFCEDVYRHLYRLPKRALRLDRKGLLNDIIYTLGLFYGAIRWTITQRKKK